MVCLNKNIHNTQCYFMHLSFYRHTKPLKGMNFGHFYRLKCSSMYVLIDVYPKIFHGKVFVFNV